VLTFDSDYRELLFARRRPASPCLVYLRLPHYRPKQSGGLRAATARRTLRGAGVLRNRGGPAPSQAALAEPGLIAWPICCHP